MAAKNGVTIVTRRLDLVVTHLKSLAGRQVLVGISAATTERDNLSIDPSRGEITNAAIGYINEFGDPSLNIPPRPHLVPGVKAALPKIIQLFKQAAQAAAGGDGPKATRALHAAGLVGQAAVVAKIDAGPFEPLKESTLRWRRWHKRFNPNAIITDTPLIETSEYRQHITYVVRARKP